MFDIGDIGGLFTDIGNSATGLFTDIQGEISGAFDKVASVFGDLGSGARDVVGTVYHDAKEVFLGPQEIVKHGIDVAGDAVKSLGGNVEKSIDVVSSNVGNTFSNIGTSVGQSLMWPIAAVAAAGLFILSRSR